MSKPFRLPRAFAEAWVAALRSGEYQQGSLCLYDLSTNSYCCLGVAGALCGIPKELMNDLSCLGGFSREQYPQLPGELQAINEDNEKNLQDVLICLNAAMLSKQYNPHYLNHGCLEIADFIEQNVAFYEEEVML